MDNPPRVPDGLLEDFAHQRANMREILSSIEAHPDQIMLDGEVVIAGDMARRILGAFFDLASLNLYLLDTLVKRHLN